MSDGARFVGRYELLREIGRGGMASVHLARQRDLDRLVALKELRALRDWDATVARRFLREAKLAGSLSHPNIVTVHEYFQHEETPFIAMEYLARGSLRPYVGRLTTAQIGGVLEGLLAGLAHAELHQIVHRDIKPENVLVTDEGRVKIADFGIAKATNAIERTAPMTATGTTVGTPTYIAPEQALARGLGPWSDLYSVGVTAFELFAGRAPFADTKEVMALVLRQINEPVPPVTAFAPSVDPRISAWIDWLVRKDPRSRPQTAAAAWDALEETLLAVLGPRWRREARLVGEAPRARVAPPARAAVDPRQAPTMPPRRRRPSREAPAAAPVKRRPRRSPLAAGAVLLVAALATGGVFVGGRGVVAAPTDEASVAAAPAGTATSAAPAMTAEADAARESAAVYRSAESQVAKEPGDSAVDRQSQAALLATAQAYDRAAAAADRGDRAGYEAALAQATARTQALPPSTTPAASTPAAPVASAPASPATPVQAPRAPAATVPATVPVATGPAVTAPPAATEPASGCAGDSLSDDPSDDDCGSP